MDNNVNELRKQQKINHGVDSYFECMTRALFTGLAAFTLTFSGSFLGQTLIKKRLPYKKKKSYILVSSILAAVVAYQITSRRTRACREVEDNHIYLKDDSS